MFSSRDAFENDFCPVRDELLGEMYRASEHGLPKLVESVSSDVRAMLALFCYRRSHLHALAVDDCGKLQRTRTDPARRTRRLHAVRAVRAKRRRRARSASDGHRKPITLSTRPLSTFTPIEETSTTSSPSLSTASPKFIASAGSPCRRRAIAHSASPGMQVRHTSGRTA